MLSRPYTSVCGASLSLGDRRQTDLQRMPELAVTGETARGSVGTQISNAAAFLQRRGACPSPQRFLYRLCVTARDQPAARNVGMVADSGQEQKLYLHLPLFIY